MITNYLESTRLQFQYYKSLGDKTFSQLTEEELLKQIDEASNSIAIMVNHLWGNMMSRWTNFLTEDGEKEWRNRDLEFEEVISSRTDLLAKWEEGWSCLYAALDSVNSSNFNELIYIRNQGHTITEAINRQLGHYSYHVGQIVFLGKMLKGNNWKSLSIPKGDSKNYNAQKFSQEKHKEHFTKDLLK